jgi:hypothetical protein
MTESPAPKKPLSERPLGYFLAVLGGLLGAAPGMLISPGVLFLLNKSMKGKDGMQSNRFAVWALIGIVAAPISFNATSAFRKALEPTRQSSTTSGVDAEAGKSNLKDTANNATDEREETVCQNSEGKYYGIIAGNSCESDSKLVTSAPDAGFLGMNKGKVESYNAALQESRKKTNEEKERLQEEAKQRKADLAEWGPFFAHPLLRALCCLH